MNKSACCICSQIRGDAANDLLAQLIGSRDYVRRVLLESEGFAVFPSVGPLTSGHILLCPKRHFRSFAQIPAALEGEFAVMKKRLSSLLAQTYGQRVHCFEHGSARKAQEPVCTVEHAHLHFVPTDTEIWPDIQHQFEWQPVESGIKNLAALVGDREYIWYESPEGIGAVTTALEGTFESQYLRKIFARVLGIGDMWNWREFPRAEVIADTYADVQHAFRARNGKQVAAGS
jgi:diadenosine tetraphosphate (Ap4A) HIT family hydrolase